MYNQGSYRHYSTFFQDFSGLVKTKFKGFPGLKKVVFNDFPGYIPLSNTDCMRSKKCTYQISSPPCLLEVGPLIAAKGPGGALKCPQRVRAEAEPGRQTYFGAFWAENKVSDESNFMEFQHFPGLFRGFPGPMPFSRTFQGLYEPCITYA